MFAFKECQEMVSEGIMESRLKTKKGPSRRRSPAPQLDRKRMGVKDGTEKIDMNVEDNNKPKQGTKLVKREIRRRSISPLPPSSSQLDAKQAKSVPPTEPKNFYELSKPSKKMPSHVDQPRVARLAPVEITNGLLRSPSKIATKSDTLKQGSRRKSLTSTKKPKVKMIRSKTEDDHADEDRQDEKWKRDKISLNIKLPEIVIDVPKDNLEEIEEKSPGLLVQSLHSASLTSDRQVRSNSMVRKQSFFTRCQRGGNRWSQVRILRHKI